MKTCIFGKIFINSTKFHIRLLSKISFLMLSNDKNFSILIYYFQIYFIFLFLYLLQIVKKREVFSFIFELTKYQDISPYDILLIFIR